MTQVCPVCGVAPVPTLVSMIWRPDAVVMGFPAVCAAAGVGRPRMMALLAAAAAPANVFRRVKFRIVFSLSDGVRGQKGAELDHRTFCLFNSTPPLAQL